MCEDEEKVEAMGCLAVKPMSRFPHPVDVPGVRVAIAPTDERWRTVLLDGQHVLSERADVALLHVDEQEDFETDGAPRASFHAGYAILGSHRKAGTQQCDMVHFETAQSQLHTGRSGSNRSRTQDGVLPLLNLPYV